MTAHRKTKTAAARAKSNVVKLHDKSAPKVSGRTIQVYKSYNFVDKDPCIDELRTGLQKSRMTYQTVSEGSGVAVSTLHNWFEGKTRRPQFATAQAAARAMGLTWKLVKFTP